MQKMRHGVMFLNHTAPFDIDRNTNRFARFRRATFYKRSSMNKNIATFLCIDHA